MHYRLPSKVFEANLPKMLGDLAVIDSTSEDVRLDFRYVEYWTPAAIVSLCAMVNRWAEQERSVDFDNLDTSPAGSYLQRIDFFDRVGVRLPEKFLRTRSLCELRPPDPSNDNECDCARTAGSRATRLSTHW